MNFESLIAKIGIYGALGDCDSATALDALDHTQRRSLSWSQIELLIVDSIRRYSSEAAECRVKVVKFSAVLIQR